MKEYVLSVAGIAIISTIFTMIMPTSKLSKFSTGILRLCCILTILAPIISIIGSVSNYFQEETTISLDETYVEDSFANFNDKCQKDAEKLIYQTYTIKNSVLIEYKTIDYSYNITRIAVNISSYELSENDVNTYRNNIKKLLSEKLGVDSGVIFVNVSS